MVESTRVAQATQGGDHAWRLDRTDLRWFGDEARPFPDRIRAITARQHRIQRGMRFCQVLRTETRVPQLRASISPDLGRLLRHASCARYSDFDEARRSAAQATMSVCAPFLGVAPIQQAPYDLTWARRCLAFNNTVLEHLRKDSNIQVVVLSSPFTASATRNSASHWLLDSTSGVEHTVAPGPDRAVAAMHDTVAALRAIGKRVVVVAHPPIAPYFDSARCLERKELGLLLLGKRRNGCNILLADY